MHINAIKIIEDLFGKEQLPDEFFKSHPMNFWGAIEICTSIFEITFSYTTVRGNKNNRSVFISSTYDDVILDWVRHLDVFNKILSHRQYRDVEIIEIKYRGSIVDYVDNNFMKNYLEQKKKNTGDKKNSFFSLKEKLLLFFGEDFYYTYMDLTNFNKLHHRSFWGPLTIALELNTLDIYYKTSNDNKKHRTIFFTSWTWEKLMPGYLECTVQGMIEQNCKNKNEEIVEFNSQYNELKWKLGDYNKTLTVSI